MGGLEEKRREARGQSLRNNCTATVHFYDAAAKTIFRCLNHSSLVLSGLQQGKKNKGRNKNTNLGTDTHAIHHEKQGGWLGLINRDSLDDLEESSVELGENLVAVFKLKANIVGFHPCDVLGFKKRKKKKRRQDIYENIHAVQLCFLVKWLKHL